MKSAEIDTKKMYKVAANAAMKANIVLYAKEESRSWASEASGVQRNCCWTSELDADDSSRNWAAEIEPFLGAIEAGKSTGTYFGVEALNIFGQSDVSSRVSFCIFAAKYKYAGVMVEWFYIFVTIWIVSFFVVQNMIYG